MYTKIQRRIWQEDRCMPTKKKTLGADLASVGVEGPVAARPLSDARSPRERRSGPDAAACAKSELVAGEVRWCG
jgi:hypothetical protein